MESQYEVTAAKKHVQFFEKRRRNGPVSKSQAFKPRLPAVYSTEPSPRSSYALADKQGLSNETRLHNFYAAASEASITRVQNSHQNRQHGISDDDIDSNLIRDKLERTKEDLDKVQLRLSRLVAHNLHQAITKYPSISDLKKQVPSFFKVSLLKLKLPAFLHIKLSKKAQLIVYASFSVQDPSVEHKDWCKHDPRVIRINSNLYSTSLFLTFEADRDVQAELVIYSEEAWNKVKRGIKPTQRPAESKDTLPKVGDIVEEPELAEEVVNTMHTLRTVRCSTEMIVNNRQSVKDWPSRREQRMQVLRAIHQARNHDAKIRRSVCVEQDHQKKIAMTKKWDVYRERR